MNTENNIRDLSELIVLIKRPLVRTTLVLPRATSCLTLTHPVIWILLSVHHGTLLQDQEGNSVRDQMGRTEALGREIFLPDDQTKGWAHLQKTG